MKNSTQQRTILVVDDETITRDALSTILEGVGYRVYRAANGTEALSNADNRNIDMFLLDVVLPDIDGFSLCEQLRQKTQHQHTPIIILTSLNDVESAEAAFNAGATDFISKPINWALLEQRLKYIFRSDHNWQELTRQQARLKKVQKTAKLIYGEIDSDLLYITFPLGQTEVFGIELETNRLALNKFLDNVYPEDRPELIESLVQTKNNFDNEINFRFTNHDGDTLTIHLTSSFRQSIDKADVTELVFQDITNQVRMSRLVEYHLYHDPVTQLPNKKRLHEDIEFLMNTAHDRDINALLIIKIGRINRVYQTLGAESANHLLQTIVQRLDQFQNENSRLYRTDSARFAILTQKQRNVDDIIEIVNRLLNRLTHACHIDSHELKITASIGIVLTSFNDGNSETLISHAESAAALAHSNGANCYQFHTAALQEHAEHRLHIESDLRRAINLNQLFLYYQPQIDTKTQSIVGMECLIRWRHPEKGLVSPFEFISIAEETDLINDIGQWILSEAFQNARYWHLQGFPELRVGINLSPRQFTQENLVANLASALHDSQINPQCVELEITESAAMANFDKTLEILNGLKALGIKLSIDDFGTGHSSLSYLQQLPVDTLKIDRAFIKDIGTEKDDGTIARTIINMAHNLGLHVIAEGIETEAQFHFLQRYHCDEIQGFLFSKPLPGDEFSHYLKNPRVISISDKIKSIS